MSPQHAADRSYNGALVGPDSVVIRMQNGKLPLTVFKQLFKTYDNFDPLKPSLGVYLVLTQARLLLGSSLFGWTRDIVRLMPTHPQLDKEIREVLSSSKPYTPEQTMRIFAENPLFLPQIIKGVLQRYGFAQARNWEHTAALVLPDGTLAVADIIVQQLRQGHIDDVYRMMGGEANFDPSSLLRYLGENVLAAAYVCSQRAPEMFLYKGRVFGLNDLLFDDVCVSVIHAGMLRLSREQQLELYKAPWLSPGIKRLLATRWSLPSQHK